MMISLLYLLIEISILLLILVLGIFYAFSLIAAIYSAPYVGSGKQDLRDMLELADIKPGLKVLELGSGKGALCVLSGQKGAHALGLEMNPVLVVYSKIMSLVYGVSERVGFKWVNFWNFKLPPETEVVYLYLLPEFMSQVWDKLERELKPGTKVISNGFVFKDRSVYQTRGSIRLYRL